MRLASIEIPCCMICLPCAASTFTMGDFMEMPRKTKARFPHMLGHNRPMLSICDVSVGCNSFKFADFKEIVCMHEFRSTASAKLGSGVISLQAAVCIYCASRPQLHDKMNSLELFAKRFDNDPLLHDTFSARLALAECISSNEASDPDDENDYLYINSDSMKFRHAEYASRPDGVRTGTLASHTSGWLYDGHLAKP